jgi:hypothetical protein
MKIFCRKAAYRGAARRQSPNCCCCGARAHAFCYRAFTKVSSHCVPSYAGTATTTALRHPCGTAIARAAPTATRRRYKGCREPAGKDFEGRLEPKVECNNSVVLQPELLQQPGFFSKNQVTSFNSLSDTFDI